MSVHARTKSLSMSGGWWYMGSRCSITRACEEEIKLPLTWAEVAFVCHVASVLNGSHRGR